MLVISELVGQSENGQILDSSTIWERFMNSLPCGEMVGRYTHNSEEFG